MNENTRKYYIAQGEEFEKASEYEKALSSYLEAFSVAEMTDEDEEELFAPGLVEDKIAFLAYRIGDYRTALTYGGKAYRANPSDQRLKSNIPFYTDGILFTNPKGRMDDIICSYIKENFDAEDTILDVGPYDGRWSDYLHGTFKHIDAVEAFEPYIERFELKKKYDNIFISDIMEFDFDHYDIIILGDILEHLTVEQAQSLIKKIYDKCKQLIIIIPYEYPQDEYDDNEYQAHKQEDLTDDIFKERYPDFDMLMCDEVRGCYIKKGSYNKINQILPYPFIMPKTFMCGMTYFSNNLFGLAAGVFSQSLERMSDEHKALMDYKLGLCYENLDKKLEALQAFIKSIELVPSYKNAFFEIMKILEKLELWNDLEFYIGKALETVNDTNNIDENVDPHWKALLLIQMTLALSKLHKSFEAYGYAALALESPMGPERKEIAEYNYNELKKELRGTLQIYDK